MLILLFLSVLRVTNQAALNNDRKMFETWENARPFYRALYVTNPPMSGNDVIILQNLLQRFPNIQLTRNGYFDWETSIALKHFQKEVGLKRVNGVLDPETGEKIIELLMSDGYKDDHVIPKGYKYKLYVPVHRNRSIETLATLYAGDGRILYKFKVRAHGGTRSDGKATNQLTTNGNTPTGLMTFDLNTAFPKQYQKQFGPYPILRCVEGLKGNAAISNYPRRYPFISNIRFGILLHTGDWPGWHKGMPMPNSLGCMKTSPSDMKTIGEILVAETGAVANNNTMGKLPYPYQPQGLISVEQID